MSKSVKDLVSEARAATGSVLPDEAQQSDAIILDVREAEELVQAGRVKDAVHIPRGVLESRADPAAESAHADLTAALKGNRPVHVLCASGARAAMAAKTLKEMGYDAKCIEGGLKGWRESGLPVAQD